MNMVMLQDIKLIQKVLAFLYTNNEKIGREIKEPILFTIAAKIIKYLGINPPKNKRLISRKLQNTDERNKK